MDERCQEIKELLPWLLNGTLSSAETIATLHHVKSCAACKQELALLAHMQNTAVNVWSSAPEPAFHDSLWSRIQEEVSQPEPLATSEAADPFFGSAKTLTQAVFPLGPLWQALADAYRTVSSELRIALVKIFPRLHAGSH